MNKLFLFSIITILIVVIVYFVVSSLTSNKPINGLIGDKYKNSCIKGDYLKYRYFIPQNQNDTLPLVVYFHGAAERGNDNKTQLNNAALKWVEPSLQAQHPCYVIIPQCKKKCFWVNIAFKSFPLFHYSVDSIEESNELKLFMSLLDEFCATHKVDTNRIYLTGFSMGSTAVWDLLSRHPHKFAASINMAGTSDTSKAALMSQIPIRVFNGEQDNIMPPALNTEMTTKIKKAGGDCELTVYKEVGHDCVENAYNTPDLFNWLFSQKKKE